MANNVGEWSATAASNTSLGAVSLQENIMLVNAVNNAFRELMAQVATGISASAFLAAYTPASASAAASITLAEDTDNGAHEVSLAAPASLSGDITVTLPDATGTLALAGNVLALSGGTMTGTLTTNGQVAFPASQNASADANTLDDYEEGTWTPVLTFATPGNLSVAYSSQVGSYTKVGRVVVAQMFIVTSTFTHTTASGTLRITGLPFTANGTSGFSFIGGGGGAGITKANYTMFSGFVTAGLDYIVFNATGSGQSSTSVAAADMPTGGTVILTTTVTYFV